jgi:hypothetical protein
MKEKFQMTNENQGLNIMGMDDIEIENTSIDDIDNESVNLIFVAIDETGSMTPHVSTMKTSLVDFKSALINSKEVDEILISKSTFSNTDVNITGYKKVDQFNTDYKAAGMTPLYDTVVQGAEKLIKYMDHLRQRGMRVKAVFAVFSDGVDTASKVSVADARRAIEDLNGKEVVTAFINFGPEAHQEAVNMGFKNILDAGSSATDLRNAFNCLSKSVIESSRSVLSGNDPFFQM